MIIIFSGLSEKLQNVFSKLKKKGKVTETDIRESMREVRMALLEADVNFKVVKDLIYRVSDRALGQEVLQSLTPGQQVIKVVNDELKQLMGGESKGLIEMPNTPTVIMMVGLQGAGKSTTAAKLARLLKDKKKPLLIAADVYRPAAIEQLKQLGKQIEVPVFSLDNEKNPMNIIKHAFKTIPDNGYDTIIIDTAGRLHIDETMMNELNTIKSIFKPHEILLVVDAMTGQDAVNVAQSFHNKLNITGVVLTKLDGDARGGAALSIKAVTNCPIKFVGTGEKMDKLEVFYPERMASRILGMGDMLTLIEKAQSVVDAEKAKELEKKLKSDSFDLGDFLEQIRQMRKMGSMEDLLSSMPGIAKGAKNLNVDEKRLDYAEAIICSMTPKERSFPDIIGGERRRRIAKGSGTNVTEVNRLLKQFEDAKKTMKQFSSLMGKGKRTGFKLPFMGR